MTAKTNNGNIIFVGSRITIPEPLEDDTWANAMIADVDDIDDDGIVYFMDDDYNEHEIELSRVELFN